MHFDHADLLAVGTVNYDPFGGHPEVALLIYGETGWGALDFGSEDALVGGLAVAVYIPGADVVIVRIGYI
jgi:hypothetical protein